MVGKNPPLWLRMLRFDFTLRFEQAKQRNFFLYFFSFLFVSFECTMFPFRKFNEISERVFINSVSQCFIIAFLSFGWALRRV